MSDPITYHVDDDGLAWITFDDPEAKVNIFTAAAMTSLGRALEALAGLSTLKAVVFISGKENVFIAGADIRVLGKLESADAAHEMSRAGQKCFDRLARFPRPVVAAIHGACAGGGFELALACHYRIASDHAKTQIGLPETKLGIFPGWGGCVRLPRLIGVAAALDHILKGALTPAALARRQGLVDEVVPVEMLRDRARDTALRLASGGLPRRPCLCGNTWPARTIVCARARRLTRARSRGHYPALLAAIDVVERGLGMTVDDALELEAREFSKIAISREAKNLIKVFYLAESTRKLSLDAWFPNIPADMVSRAVIRRVGVIGAGVMGSGIAHWCAARGFDVRVRDVTPEFVARGMQTIAGLFEEGVKRHKLTRLDAERGLARVTATTDWTGFDGCDLVIEAVIEDVAAKKPVFEQLSQLLRPETVLATNTSAIPIDELASFFARPERVVGMHFFNPVSRMPLIEIIIGRRTSRAAAEAALGLSRAIGKQAVVCKDSPGFLVNRVLMPYLNEAGRMWMEGAAVTALDEAMLDFGMPMGPMRLLDEIGIDVGYHVARELAQYLGERMTVCDVLIKMNQTGLKGRKTGKGFYCYHGNRQTPNPELAGLFPGVAARAFSSDDIIARLVGVMVAEAKLCLAEGVVRSADDIDLAMILGTGFPPFRGGLMHGMGQKSL